MADSTGTKVLLSLAVIVIVGPIDLLGFAPGSPELTVAALFAIWGIDWDEN